MLIIKVSILHFFSSAMPQMMSNFALSMLAQDYTQPKIDKMLKHLSLFVDFLFPYFNELLNVKDHFCPQDLAHIRSTMAFQSFRSLPHKTLYL